MLVESTIIAFWSILLFLLAERYLLSWCAMEKKSWRILLAYSMICISASFILLCVFGDKASATSWPVQIVTLVMNLFTWLHFVGYPPLMPRAQGVRGARTTTAESVDTDSSRVGLGAEAEAEAALPRPLGLASVSGMESSRSRHGGHRRHHHKNHGRRHRRHHRHHHRSSTQEERRRQQQQMKEEEDEPVLHFRELPKSGSGSGSAGQSKIREEEFKVIRQLTDALQRFSDAQVQKKREAAAEAAAEAATEAAAKVATNSQQRQQTQEEQQQQPVKPVSSEIKQAQSRSSSSGKAASSQSPRRPQRPQRRAIGPQSKIRLNLPASRQRKVLRRIARPLQQLCDASPLPEPEEDCDDDDDDDDDLMTALGSETVQAPEALIAIQRPSFDPSRRFPNVGLNLERRAAQKGRTRALVEDPARLGILQLWNLIPKGIQRIGWYSAVLLCSLAAKLVLLYAESRLENHAVATLMRRWPWNLAVLLALGLIITPWRAVLCNQM